MELPCCGEEGPPAPCECCAEAECTYLPTASPVLTGAVDMPAVMSAEAVLASLTAASVQCGSGFEGGDPSRGSAEHCALFQVWRR
jgi:hypothetical protein